MNFVQKGNELREEFKKLVIDFMNSKEICDKNNTGIKQSEIFYNCGMNWGDKPNCTSSQQQYWVVAILRQLQEDGIVQRDDETKKWRLK